MLSHDAFSQLGVGNMGAWAPINISSGITNGCQYSVL